jgi:hypothetical protein
MVEPAVDLRPNRREVPPAVVSLVAVDVVDLVVPGGMGPSAFSKTRRWVSRHVLAASS